MERISCFLFVSASLLFVGCGGGGGEHPTTPVSATVLYHGQPVEGATVTFLNDEHEKPVLAVGRTDAEGVAKMKTYDEGDGAIRGQHQVTILKAAVAESQADLADVESDDYDPEAIGELSSPESLIPAKYGNRTSSGLTVDVGEEPKEVTFELED